MSDTGCFACIHHSVCMYFGRWIERFPYKDDKNIGPFMNGISETLSNACSHFEVKEQLSHDKNKSTE